MVKVKVVSKTLSSPVEKDFTTKELAEKWIEKHTKLGSWGTPDTWIEVSKEDKDKYLLCREIIKEITVSGKVVEKEIAYSCLKKGDFTTEITTILYDDTELKMARLRERRNEILAKSDKYMLADYPMIAKLRQLVKEYRQYLRDITKANMPDIKIFKFKEFVEFKHGDIVDAETRRHYKEFTEL